MDSTLVNKLGFAKKGRKHRVYCLEIEGKEVVRTLISHGAREISDRMMAVMARQMGISRAQLLDIVKCALYREDYCQILEEKGLMAYVAGEAAGSEG